MGSDELDKLMAELKTWAAQAEFGGQKRLADRLGVSAQKLNHWITGRKLPNLRDGLELQVFLKMWRKKRK